MVKVLLASVVALGLVSVGVAEAQDLRDQQVQACTGDAFRLCSDAIPDEGRVTACMEVHRASLSPGCLAVFGPPPGTETMVRARLTTSPRGVR